MIETILKNKEWIFSGIGVLFISLIIGFFTWRKKNNTQTSNTNSISQKSNDNSENVATRDSSPVITGGTVTINYGISLIEAKEIAMSIYKENFIKLSKDASDLAFKRAEELVNDFLDKMHDSNSDITLMNDPSNQFALYEAQKEYAKNGNETLKILLVNLLTEKCNKTDFSLEMISLNEALTVAPKLPIAYWNILTLIFILTKTYNAGLGNHEILKNYLQSHVTPFLTPLAVTETIIAHLEYSGVVTKMEVASYHPIPYMFRMNYQGLFQKGFSIDEIDKSIFESLNKNSFLMPCFNDQNKFQIKLLNMSQLESNKIKFTDDEFNKVSVIFNNFTYNVEEIEKALIRFEPRINELFNIWNTTELKNLQLTTVGIAIAYSNFKRINPNIKLNLRDWLTDSL